jgi:hypothetical protein
MMTDTASTAPTPSPPSSDPSDPPKPNPIRWAIALLVAGLGAWSLVNYSPIQFTVPEELRGVDIYSPRELQDAAAAKDTEIYWKSSVVKLVFAGLCFGAVPLLVANWPLGGRQRLPVILAMVLGPVFGLLAALAGLGVRHLLNSSGPLSRFGEGDGALMGDVMVFAVLSVLLVLPISIAVLLQGGPDARQKAGVIPLAGILAGMVMPIVTSMLFPAQQTNEYPPTGGGLTAVWFIALAGFILVLVMIGGSKKKKGSDVELSQSV